MPIRKRTMWLALPIAAAGSVLVLWLCLADRDSDIHWIGPKTKQIRTMLAWLDTPVDLADFQVCKNVRDGLEVLCDKYKVEGQEIPVVVLLREFDEGSQEIHPFLCPIRYPSDPAKVAVKGLLRMMFDQTSCKDPAFLLRHDRWLEVTTSKEVRQMREDYQKAYKVSAMDRLRQGWSEAFGGEGHLPAD